MKSLNVPKGSTAPIDPTLWPYHGIQWESNYHFFKQLVFGSRSSPKIFDTISQAVCWIASNNYNIKNILHLLVTMKTFLSILGIITLHAKFKCPKRLNSSLFVHDDLLRNDSII
jgi:hypothetical protein